MRYLISLLFLTACATPMDHGMRALDRCQRLCKEYQPVEVKIEGAVDIAISCKCGKL